ncbi:glycoside hydrolase [Crepidotus variabilis]|uniref:lytic cellulose monooxygenase (C4-dehydrogenating) n=1 Tax=Crepidotus variabilis TaxID=179855 RepID=A0A9P6EHR7_9AGAR|nr:glycoside hydrolase [Crepidotus variabilis]
MMRCNNVTVNATETITVKPGQLVGLAVNASQSAIPSIYHTGPAALYLSKAAGLAQDYVGDGDWIKFASWGPTYNPFNFTCTNATELTALLPNIPSGEYLLRAEHSAVHDINSPQFFIGCAQIKVENPGTPVDLPAGVKIPGYVTGKEPSFVFNISAPDITYYPMPAPPVADLPVVVYP